MPTENKSQDAEKGGAALGEVDINSHALTLTGVRLEEAVNDVTNGTHTMWNISQNELILLPSAGWRTVAHTPRTSRTADREYRFPATTYIAAPALAQKDRWALISITERGTASLTAATEQPGWVVSAHGGVHRLRPSKAARREGLTLEWPYSPLMVIAGTVPDLMVVLRTGRHGWTADPDDACWVHGWVTDELGSPEDPLGWFGRGWSPPLPDIPAQSFVQLPVWVFRTTISELPVGTYGVRAALTSLGLRTGVRIIEVVHADRGAHGAR